MKRILPALVFALAAFSLQAAPVPAYSNATVSKLVGTNPSTVCTSGSDAISVLPGTTVFYCYNFVEHSIPKFILNVWDDHLGQVIANRTTGVMEPVNATRSTSIGLSPITNVGVFTVTDPSVGNITYYHNDTAQVDIQFPLQVHKYVGTEPPPACGSPWPVIVDVGKPLYYCYQTENISNMTVDYGVFDDQLGAIVSNRSISPYSNDTVWANTTFPPDVRELTNVATWTVAGLAGMNGTAPATAYAAYRVPTASGTMLILFGLALVLAATAVIRLR